MNRIGFSSIKRVAASAGIAVLALGAVIGVGGGTASAIATHLTSTSVSCAPGATYYGTVSCTVTVSDLFIHLLPFQGYPSSPTGSASIASITGRLPSGSCTLVAIPSTTKSACTITLTPRDTGPMLPLATYSPTGGVHIGSGGPARCPSGPRRWSSPLTIRAAPTATPTRPSRFTTRRS